MLNADYGLDELVVEVADAAHRGLSSVWLAQGFAIDALTALAVIAREVPAIELGTAVVPTYPRHPLVLAGQALTTQAASGGRLVLGIGLSHQVVIERVFGYSFAQPIRHMREYLAVLRDVIHTGETKFKGETLQARTMGPVHVPGATPMPILLAALGPKMLELAGAVGDGTITWMAGARAIGEHLAPEITRAADHAGRPAPRVVAGVPVCVTNDVSRARELAAATFGFYGGLPSYRAMLDREGVADAADIAIIGDEASVSSQ
ncbi:MAG: Coenzyme F420-dependent N10-methylene tetrahydromethanopterin reductase-like protein, partial [Acidimicrobiia bacterium]|nr:Coenzyme F420-dependent N10-methylene tetrahydromethanopterin reductase-like protein [Acidimicrobiia bacterium]